MAYYALYKAMKPFFAHLALPAPTDTLLWDMDGVLIDSLQHDIAICDALFSRHLGRAIRFSPDFIRSIFALDPAMFIDALLAQAGERTDNKKNLLDDYLELRRTTPFPLLPGVEDALKAATALGFKQGVVSNNASKDIERILKRAGIAQHFSAIIGNDVEKNGQRLRKKPAPDTYLFACETLGALPQKAAVFEDSVLGCTAGLEAGAYVIGLLTGSAGQKELEELKPKAPQQILPNLIDRPL